MKIIIDDADWFLFPLYKISSTLITIIINIRGQIENRPLQNTRLAGRKWLTAGC